MITRVEISGKVYHHDLIRVNSISQLKLLSMVVVNHPEDQHLCMAQVLRIWGNGINIKEFGNCIAPYQWNISERDLYKKVYLINDFNL